MSENVTIFLLWCGICNAEVPHLWTSCGGFACLGCRELGRNSLRRLLSTELLYDESVRVMASLPHFEANLENNLVEG